jgi:phosphoglycerate kinase
MADYSNKLSVQDISVSGKKVFMRVDFNVPLKDGKVDNDKRIKAALPTIKLLKDKGARLILASHLGRPKGKKDPAQSLAPVAPALSALIGSPVKFVDDCIGDSVKKVVDAMKDGDIILLENLRFYAEEEKNDAEFAKKLASVADLYVNDAFGAAHRAHASTEGITKHVAKSACGLLMKKELDYLGAALANPKRPFVAIMGGAKVSDKIMVIEHLLKSVDKIIIGGGMTFTFLKAMGKEIGKSILEADKVDLAKELLEKGKGKLEIPTDFAVSETFDFGTRTVGPLQTVDMDHIPANTFALDVGPKSIQHFTDIITGAKTVIWNGPMGVFEIEATAKGTFDIAHALVKATQNGATTVVGGGDSASAISKAGLSDKVSHVSTGGGASLEFLEGKVLPGVIALSEK